MKRSICCLLLGLALVSTGAVAENPGKPAERLVTSEALAGSVTLPASASGSLVMPPCYQCAPKSFRAIASTTYFIGERQVTLAELKATVIRRPQSILTVSYAVQSGTLLTVSAEAPSRRQPETR